MKGNELKGQLTFAVFDMESASEKDRIVIDRAWAMPNSETFSIKPIKQLLAQIIKPEEVWVDPFARNSKVASVTNDLNPNTSADYHMDALEFLRMFDDNEVDGVLYDPPYSPRQIKECYDGIGLLPTSLDTSGAFWGNQKREIARIVKRGGRVITFGWNSGGIGKKHGFSITRILLVAHGGWHNDTIVTVEIKE